MPFELFPVQNRTKSAFSSQSLQHLTKIMINTGKS